MLAATICAAPGSKARNKPPPTREQLVERCYDYRARLTNAQKGLDAQREQLVGLRKQVGSMQGELSDLEKQLEAEKSKRQELEREVSTRLCTNQHKHTIHLTHFCSHLTRCSRFGAPKG
jgi:chromosome segregation ATPase